MALVEVSPPKILSIALSFPVIFAFLPIVNPLNFSYPAVFNFGDSNSDTGDMVAGVAFPVGPPNGQTYFLRPSVDAMHLPFLNPYLDSVGAPSFQNGCNFAAGGSTILPANAASRCPFSFGIQVAQFVRFKARVLELLSKDEKLCKYLPLEDYFQQGLYMLDAGQNDLDGSFYSKSEDQVLAFIPTILSEFEIGIKRLYDVGARNFWIHNTGPLGCLPRIISTFGKNTSKLDQLGCVGSHGRAANLFNAQLLDLCIKFRGQFPDVNITYVDIFSIKLELISNFSQYGFKQPLAACCGYGGPPLNFDNRIACGETKILNGSMVSASPCNNTSEYINWDGNHYTEAANRYIAEKVLSGNYTNSLLSVHLPFIAEPKL